jgi:hypothetical protein
LRKHNTKAVNNEASQSMAADEIGWLGRNEGHIVSSSRPRRSGRAPSSPFGVSDIMSVERGGEKRHWRDSISAPWRTTATLVCRGSKREEEEEGLAVKQ